MGTTICRLVMAGMAIIAGAAIGAAPAPAVHETTAATQSIAGRGLGARADDWDPAVAAAMEASLALATASALAQSAAAADAAEASVLVAIPRPPS